MNKETSEETHEDPPEDGLSEAHGGRKHHRRRQSETEKGYERERERSFSRKLERERGKFEGGKEGFCYKIDRLGDNFGKIIYRYKSEALRFPCRRLVVQQVFFL